MTMVTDRPLIVHCPVPVPLRPEALDTLQLVPGMVHAWFATLEQLEPQHTALQALLDSEELERTARFRFAHDRDRYVLGHGFLRQVLGRYLPVDPKALHPARGPFGKPFLEGHPVHFNLSDTKDAVLVAVAHQPIGADVETLDRRTDHDRVADHYFTPGEVADIRKAANGKHRFLELWTRKESVLKASGVGIMDDLQHLEVHLPVNRMTISHPEFVRMAAAEYHVRTFTGGSKHVVSLASETDFQPLFATI